MKYKYKPEKRSGIPKTRHESVPPLRTSTSNRGHSLVEALQENQAELKRQNRELLETQKRLEDSHRKYAELYDLAPIVYLTIDLEGIICESNLTGANMLGIARDRLIGRQFLDFVAEESHETFKFHHKEAFTSGEKQTSELKLIRGSGAEFYGHVETTCVSSSADNSKCWATISDITQRKMMENALRESKLKNLAILNTIPDTIFIQAENGIYIDCHAQTPDTPYISPMDFLGKHTWEVLPQAIAKPLDQLRKKALKTGEIQEFEYSLPFGQMLRFYETRMVRLGNDKVLSIVRDITEQKQAEKALHAAHNMLERRVDERTAEVAEINRQLKKEIKERKRAEKIKAKTQQMETIGRLASGVAHEVRNPLNSIQAIVAVLNQELGDHKEFKSCSSHINVQVERLSRLMKDLLELGKQNQEEFLKIESIPTLCKSAIHLWEQSQEKQTHRVTLKQTEKAANAHIQGDMGRLQQVFINLLDNASQHSPENSEITINILNPTKKNIRIRVIDNGSGIKSENLPHVFEPFFTKRHSGTGLGLSIVKHIIENHSGSIKIKNNDPKPGCTIEITFPLADSKKN